VILPKGLLPLAAAITFPAPDDGRPVFLIPHPEGILLGTTDLYHDEGLEDPRPTEAEIDYLLHAARAAFPGPAPGREHVLGAFAGLRPILDTHAENPSEASREEDIWEEGGMLSVAGGKLTTWRSTAEDALDAALQLLPEERARRAAPCATAGTPLGGLAPRDLGRRIAAAYELEPDVARGMARRLGAVAWTAPLLARSSRELQPLVAGLDLCAAEVRAHLRWGGVVRLDDLLLRRVRLGMWSPAAVPEVVPRLRKVVVRELGWSSRRWGREVAELERELVGWTLAGAVPGTRSAPVEAGP
jgi:glycerol-3-phosphate dehydrogenase